MAEDHDQVSDLSTELFVKLGLRQSQLLQAITSTLKELSTVKPGIRLKGLDNFECRIASHQEEAALLETAFDQPDTLLTEAEKRELQQSGVHQASLMASFCDMVRHGLPEERRVRILSLLEHLERRLSDKKTVVNFNRAMTLSTAAFIVAVISLIVSTA
ncbi:hypothetical protein ACFLXE_02930 [Chloroflexota bacterium]